MLNRLVEKRDGWNNLAHEKIFELEEENESLKDVNAQCCNDYSAMRRDVLRYKKENEQLKTFLEALREELSLADRDNTILEKENEQLKKDVDKYNKKIEIMANAFLYAEDLIDVEQVFFTEVYEPSENFDEELLCEFSNLFFSDYLSDKKVE